MSSTRETRVLLIAAIVLCSSILMFLGLHLLFPINTAYSQSSLNVTPASVPPVNTAVLKDPSGTYTFTYLPSGQYMMNLSTYEQLLHDPYSSIGNGVQVQVQGTTVILTLPQSNTTS